jgi:hypothetical protein
MSSPFCLWRGLQLLLRKSIYPTWSGTMLSKHNTAPLFVFQTSGHSGASGEKMMAFFEIELCAVPMQSAGQALPSAQDLEA